MDRFEEIVFPRRLHRVDYVIRILVADGLLWLLLSSGSPSDPTLGGLRLVGIWLGSLVIGIYSLFFVLLPRVRDVGWDSWLVLLGLVPYVGPLFHFVLLFVPPERDVADESI
jgi:uncharacterized membrane protein YhaH (DUF805 family)